MKTRKILLVAFGFLLLLGFLATYQYFYRYAPCSCTAYSEGVLQINGAIKEFENIVNLKENDADKATKLLYLKNDFESKSNVPTCLKNTKRQVLLGLLIEIERLDPNTRFSNNDLKILNQYKDSPLGYRLPRGFAPEEISAYFIKMAQSEMKRMELWERGLIFCNFKDLIQN